MRKLIEKICECCGKPYKTREPKQKFCSLSCSASYNNIGRVHTNKTKEKISQSLHLHYDGIPHKDEEHRQYNGKKIRVMKSKCPICGERDCHRQGICKHTKKFFINLTYFGLDEKKIGTNEIFGEYEKVKKALETEYNDNHMSPSDLKRKYSYPKTFENITHLLKELGIVTRDLSTSQKNAILTGKSILPKNIEQVGLSFKQGWHKTWQGKKVFYRSSYEEKYAKFLDEKKIPYDMESIRIEYFDTKEKKIRIAIPDFLLTETNEIIEVKSRITLHKQNIIDKFQKYKELGYTPKLLYEGTMYNDKEIENIEESGFII